jgi:hypothetical protein
MLKCNNVPFERKLNDLNDFLTKESPAIVDNISKRNNSYLRESFGITPLE